MCKNLTSLAEDFARYRGKKKWAKYPKDLWKQAVQLCEHHPIKRIALALKVNPDSLRRHLHSKTKSCDATSPFIPLDVTSNPSVQLRLSGKTQMALDFDGPVDELAKLIIRIQEGLSC